jgi:hypothetical protein
VEGYLVAPTQLVISGIISLIVYSMVLFAIYKIFQISTDVSEMKSLLRDIRRNTEEVTRAAPPPQPQSAEALVRAVHASSYEALVGDPEK